MPSTSTDDRWIEFCTAALAHGIRSTLSMPLRAGDRRFGAMNLYADAINAFDDEAVVAAGRFATQASIVLANAQLFDQASTLNIQLNEAMRSREVSSQAQGIIMGAMRCDPEAAFAELVRQSQHENRKLRDVANSIVNNVARRHPASSPPHHSKED